VTASAADRRIRELRPARATVDPYSPHGSVLDSERRPNGAVERALTVFLAGAECPFTCSFCDLWRWTIEGTTPVGALTRQLQRVLDAIDGPTPDRLKLYNASNFFDDRAVPPEDSLAISRLAGGFGAVTVESHANTIGPRVLSFARRMSARLEIAVGLETIHPNAAAQLNKRLDLARFDRAARFLGDNDFDLRVFVLLGAPHIPVGESVDWTVRTVEYAAEHGAAVVSIIPVRGGNGELERLQSLGHFTPPTLSQLEEALERCLQFEGTVVTADLWDIERLAECSECGPTRIDRLGRLSLGGAIETPITCSACGAE
jgi:archaeosine synthase beta-subunit